ncbi:MAG: hypothetical protein Q8K78_02155 [Planctomycetaceae bacterium]|nr:hypothetical protein [Planctomycetaceae bacterium]
MEFDPGSYRDRDARVFAGADGQIYRTLSPSALAEWKAVSNAAFFQEAMQSGRVVQTDLLNDARSAGVNGQTHSSWAGILHHELVPFVSYPYEWTFSMLRAAALLHLELLISAVESNFILKDGTAYNVQWRGLQPVFIDVASFERLPPGTPWAGYRQFCQTFLYPLFLLAYKGIAFHPWLRGRLEGITPRDCWQLMSFRDVFRRGVATHVGMHAWMESKPATAKGKTSAALADAGFGKDLILNNARGLIKLIERLRWSPPKSTWSDYAQSNHYTDVDRQAKQQFVRRSVQTRHWRQVWDLGGNVGLFGEIAAENADLVLIVESDHAAMEHGYQRLQSAPANVRQRVLPLVGNVVDLAGNVGWRGRERRAFVERGQPDLILCLALIHHVVIGHGVPMDEFMDWLADLRASLVIEFVARDDPKVQEMMQNRRDACVDYSAEAFETALARRFRVHARETLSSGTRTLVFAEPQP